MVLEHIILYVSKLWPVERTVTADQIFYPDESDSKEKKGNPSEWNEIKYLPVCLLAILFLHVMQIKFQCQTSYVVSSPSKGGPPQSAIFATCNWVGRQHSCVLCLHMCSCLFAEFNQVASNGFTSSVRLFARRISGSHLHRLIRRLLPHSFIMSRKSKGLCNKNDIMHSCK